MKGRDPDRGPPMIEGAHHWDKGYMSDEERSGLGGEQYGEKGHQRGNRYLDLQNQIISKDNSKMKRGKFTKIA